MTDKITTLGLDADDTLWENEIFFMALEKEFSILVADYCDATVAHDALMQIERQNVPTYGFGVKGYALNLIETAIDLSNGQIEISAIERLICLTKEMLHHPIELKADVQKTLEALCQKYRLVMVTKGDLLHQQYKIDHSNLNSYFSCTHIVNDKTTSVYYDIFSDQIKNTVMIGNSMKSDILPALAAGAAAIHIPSEYEWDLEKADPPKNAPRFYTAQKFSQIGEIVSKI